MSSTTTHLLSLVQTWSHNFQHNVSDGFSQLSIKGYLRLVVIIGAYALLRPYLIQLGGKFQARDHGRELDPRELSSSIAADNNARSMTGLGNDDTDDEEEEEEEEEEAENVNGGGIGSSTTTTASDWGRRARKRQRQMIRRLLEAQEKLLREEAEVESDKDIEEFLVEPS